MRRASILVSVVAAVLLGVVAIGRGGHATAQDATPAAAPNLTVGQLAPIGQPFELIPGVDVEFLNEGPAAQAPGHNVVNFRVTLRGGEAPPHTHPGTSVLTVESGTFSSTVVAGTTATVMRAGAAPERVSAPGTELVLNPGEGLVYGADVVHTARAAGAEPAVAVVAALYEVGQPVLALADEHGTPMAMGTPAS